MGVEKEGRGKGGGVGEMGKGREELWSWGSIGRGTRERKVAWEVDWEGMLRKNCSSVRNVETSVVNCSN